MRRSAAALQSWECVLGECHPGVPRLAVPALRPLVPCSAAKWMFKRAFDKCRHSIESLQRASLESERKHVHPTQSQ